jgi:hypothetical protein
MMRLLPGAMLDNARKATTSAAVLLALSFT